MKYLVAPSAQIARYWAKEMGLEDFEYLSRLDDLRGRRFPASDVIYIEGDKFDNPIFTLRGNALRAYLDFRDVIVPSRVDA